MIIWILVITPLWATVVWRASNVISQPRSRPLYSAFLTLAISLTAIRPETSDWIIGATGTEALPDFIKHVFGMIAVYSILLWVISVIPRKTGGKLRLYQRIALGRTRKVITVLAVAASLILFPFMATDQEIAKALAPSMAKGLMEPGMRIDRVFDQIGHPLGAASLEIFQAYLAFGMVLCGLMCLDAYRTARRTTLGIGMAMVSIGCGAGFCYALTRFTYLLLLMVGFAMPQWILNVGTNLFVIISVLFIVVGTSVPMFERLGNMWSYRASLIRLRPLWDEVTAAVPSVLLDGQPSAQHDRFSLTSLYLRRQRRTVEIMDAVRALQPWASAELDHAVRSASNGTDALFASALLVRVASARCLGGDAPFNASETAPLIVRDDDPLRLRYLEQVSWALGFFQASPGEDDVRKLLPSLDQRFIEDIKLSLGLGKSLREMQR